MFEEENEMLKDLFVNVALQGGPELKHLPEDQASLDRAPAARRWEWDGLGGDQP